MLLSNVIVTFQFPNLQRDSTKSVKCMFVLFESILFLHVELSSLSLPFFLAAHTFFSLVIHYCCIVYCLVFFLFSFVCIIWFFLLYGECHKIQLEKYTHYIYAKLLVISINPLIFVYWIAVAMWPFQWSLIYHETVMKPIGGVIRFAVCGRRKFFFWNWILAVVVWSPRACVCVCVCCLSVGCWCCCCWCYSCCSCWFTQYVNWTFKI